jgi:hypothetical protein
MMLAVQAQVDFLKEIFSRYVVEGEIFDAACGTGRYTIPLLATGHEVSSFESRKDMRGMADGRASKGPRPVRISWVPADGGVSYGIVLNLFTNFNYLVTEEELKERISWLSNRTRVKGIVIFDIINPFHAEGDVEAASYIEEHGDERKRFDLRLWGPAELSKVLETEGLKVEDWFEGFVLEKWTGQALASERLVGVARKMPEEEE